MSEKGEKISFVYLRIDEGFINVAVDIDKWEVLENPSQNLVGGSGFPLLLVCSRSFTRATSEGDALKR